MPDSDSVHKTRGSVKHMLPLRTRVAATERQRPYKRLNNQEKDTKTDYKHEEGTKTNT